YYDANGVPFRAKLIGNFTRLTGLATIAPGIYNWLVNTPATANLIRKTSGFALKRSLPELQPQTLKSWFRKKWPQEKAGLPPAQKQVYLFCDEFTNYNDTHIGIKAVQLLQRLGYD